MCLIVATCPSAGSYAHLNILLFQEQIWPRLSRGKLIFRECYDIVFRMDGDTRVDRLLILSPQSVAGSDGVFRLLDPTKLAVCDSLLDTTEIETVAHEPDRFQLRFANPPDHLPSEYQVTQLKPRLELPVWHDSGDEHMKAAFYGTGMTLLEVLFPRNEYIEPFDPTEQAKTTYWLRLAFEPKVKHDVDTPIEFGLSHEKPAVFKVQPSVILSPSEVEKHLRAQLEYVSMLPAYESGVLALYRQLFDNILLNPHASRRIQDHRIVLGTSDQNLLVLNHFVQGPCGFVGSQSLNNSPRQRNSKRQFVPLIRWWIAGASYYPKHDALMLASAVYDHLKQWASLEIDAKASFEISSMMAPASHANVCHTLKGLREMGYIKEPRPNHYFVPSDSKPKSGSDFVVRPHADFLSALYGPLNVDDESTASRFDPKGFRIDFDLAFCV